MENREALLISPSFGTAVLEAPRRRKAPTIRKRQGKKVLSKPFVSIIIPAHNEEAYIGRTLETLNHQAYPQFEIIVVANGCTDRTTEVARELCDQLVIMPERGLSRARNLGGQAARGKLLVFLDADTLLRPDGLETISREFTRECAAGTLKGCPDLPRPFYRLMYAVKNFQHGHGLHEGSSGVILCWRDHFIGSGGFDETLHVSENSDLIRKLRFFGKYAYISKTAATTSMRRYETAGLPRMVCLWLKLWFQSLFSDLRHQKYEAVR